MKIPVLTGSSLAVKEFFDPVGTLFLCGRTPEEISDSIVEIMYTPQEQLADRWNAAYEVFDRRFSVPVFSSQMKKLLDS